MNRRNFLSLSAMSITLGQSSLAQGVKKKPTVIDGRIIYGDINYGAEAATVTEEPMFQGTEIQIDLPKSQHIKNFGAPKDNKGLCVFASMSHAARWHNVRPLMDVIHKIQEGGGWPEKVDQVFKQFAPNLKYVQYEGNNPSFLDKCLAEDRPAQVTYGYGERYQMQTIYHMVNLLHLDDKLACILDNNFPGTYEWMSRNEFLARWKHTGQGWAYCLLAPPPPPIPHS